MEIVRRILKDIVPGTRVVMYGSPVAGNAKTNSDLDLCLMSGTSVPFEKPGARRDAFSDSNLPYKVDITDWSATSPDFRQLIQETCVDLAPM